MSRKNTSPLRYPGGKTRACKVLDNILNDHFDINKYDTLISPFFGGGSFEFHIQHKYNLIIKANDKFLPLYTFWKQCKTNNDDICKELYTKINTIDKDTFKQCRETIIGEKIPINQAIMYFVINRCSFSGATLSGGFSDTASKNRFTTSSIDRIGALDLSNFDIECADFSDFIEEKYKKSNKNLMFLDPPYYLEKNSKLYGKNGDMHKTFDHTKLYNTIKNKKNWIMTYNDCEYIRNLYKDFKIIETNWTYGMNKTKKSSEIVIVSE